MAMPGFLQEDTLRSLKPEAGILTEVREMVCVGSGIEPKQTCSALGCQTVPMEQTTIWRGRRSRPKHRG